MTRDLAGRTLAPLVLGLVHAAVDWGCAFVLFRDLAGAHGMAPALVVSWIIAYDALAFAAQAPLAILADRWRGYRRFSLLGIGSVAVALGIGPFAPTAAATTAGVGNALFHIGAGGHVLRAAGPGARAIGVFVGPGAIGLCLGILCGQGQSSWRLPLAAALVGAWLATGWAVPHGDSSGPDGRHEHPPSWAKSVWLGVGLLLFTVTLRSTIGDNIVSNWRGQSASVVVALALAATAGKMLGGAAADRLGWLRFGGGVLIVAVLAAAGARASPVAAVGGMLLLQATTPLTLKAIHRLIPDRPALAFGIPSAALLLGAAPGLVGVWLLPTWPILAAATLLSAAAVASGLWLLGHR